MNSPTIIPFEDEGYSRLLPLVYTRPVYELRPGARSLLQAMREAFPEYTEWQPHCRAYLYPTVYRNYGIKEQEVGPALYINGRWICEEGPALNEIRRRLAVTTEATAFVQDHTLIAAYVPAVDGSFRDKILGPQDFGGAVHEVAGARLITSLWDLISEIGPALKRDAMHFSGNPVAEHRGVITLNRKDICVARGCTIQPGSILNAEPGPILIDSGATVSTGTVLTGPLYIGPGTFVKPGALLETASIGPMCKVNGEIHNSVLHAFASKAHFGYLGDSYLGAWTNLGAGTSNSNLKNDYGEVSLYCESSGTFEKSGRQFLGLVMGDHSKSGIHTMFNTGTVAGVFCNIYGGGYRSRWIPSFTWGERDEYRLEKAMRVAEAVYARRNMVFDEVDQELMARVFEMTAEGRAAFLAG